MRVLVACEISGKVRDAFAARGHDAWSCDLEPSDRPGNHLQCDVLDILYNGWDLVIAHPPCTFLANSGVRWLYGGKGKQRDELRWGQMQRAALFFKAFLLADVPLMAIENPIMHRYAKEIIGQEQTQIIQPWQFGHGETKATCLWLKGLPELKPTNIVDGREAKIHRMPPGKDRAKLRSETYQGIADAMAEQWGNLQAHAKS